VHHQSLHKQAPPRARRFLKKITDQITYCNVLPMEDVIDNVCLHRQGGAAQLLTM
jgi:hypothetical protein